MNYRYDYAVTSNKEVPTANRAEMAAPGAMHILLAFRIYLLEV